MDKKMISPHNEWYIENVLVCVHFSSKLAHGTYCLRSITQLLRLLGIVKKNPMLMPKPCSGDFNNFFIFWNFLTKLELPLHGNSVQLTNRYSHDYVKQILIV